MTGVVKPRPRRERVLSILQPAASLCIRMGMRWGVDPVWLVTLHGLLGVAAAFLVYAAGPSEGSSGTSAGWVFAALLLLGKAIFDNADGGLARASGRVTRFGRYYDTGVDLISGVAIFAALATLVPAGLALIGWLASTIVLSLDFNMERLYKAAWEPQPTSGPNRDDASQPPLGAPRPVFTFFEGLYRVLFQPQDRWIERADRALFRRVEGRAYAEAPRERRRAWSDLFSTGALVDLGLSSQTVVLAVLLLVGIPGAFPWLTTAGLGWALLVQVRRVLRYRAYRRHEASSA